jgi:hypothetical protein
VYAGAASGFMVDVSNRIATVPDTTFTVGDVEPPIRFFVVTADDVPFPAMTMPVPLQGDTHHRKE